MPCVEIKLNMIFGETIEYHSRSEYLVRKYDEIICQSSEVVSISKEVVSKSKEVVSRYNVLMTRTFLTSYI